MLKVIKKCENSDVLVITPLKTGDKISSETRTTIKRNDTLLTWVSYESNNLRPTNLKLAMEAYKENIGKLPEYVIGIDNNIILGRHFIDRLFEKLTSVPSQIYAYAYGTLKYEGSIDRFFPAIQFDLQKLLEHNYISSNSLFRTDVIEHIPLVEDADLKRLLDWAYLLKLVKKGFIGIHVPDAVHIASTTNQNISAGNEDDYNLKRQRVYDRFIIPLIDDIRKARLFSEEQKKKNNEINNITDSDTVNLI